MTDLIVKSLGEVAYQPVWERMSTFTDTRSDDTPDELWVVQHPPVFTQGQAGKAEHLLNPGDIPVVQSDRGGQVTYHGPGQIIVYPLINLRRLGLGVRDMVTLLENVAVDLLAEYGVEGYPRKDAPGVYVQTTTGEAKIAQLGLRVRRGCCFHGMSVNVDMDLKPFTLINPCGYQGLAVTQLKDLAERSVELKAVEQSLINLISKRLGLTPMFDQVEP